VGPHGHAAVALKVEDHEMAAGTLSRLGFVLFSEKDLDIEEGLA
jgi:hypothetical protein